MGKLAELLKTTQAAPHTPTSVHEPETHATSIEGTHNNSDYNAILTTCGHNPDRVTFAAPPAVTTRWKLDGTQVTSYRYKLIEKPAATSLEPLIELVKAAALHKPVNAGGRSVFVFQFSDIQAGKIDGYGVEGTQRKFLESVEAAKQAYLRAAQHEDIGAIHIAGLGDCIENGGVSQGGLLAWRQSLTITEQVRMWRRLLMHVVREFAPLTDNLVVSIVGGNHDDATRSPVQTRADDNWATEGAIAVADTLLENPGAYGHVKVIVPPIDQGYMTVKVLDTVFTCLHGHQFRKGKALEWWASQSLYQGEPAEAHFLIHGHYHSTYLAQDGPRTVICSPTFEGSSQWYREKTGAIARQGGLVYVTRGDEFSGFARV